MVVNPMSHYSNVNAAFTDLYLNFACNGTLVTGTFSLWARASTIVPLYSVILIKYQQTSPQASILKIGIRPTINNEPGVNEPKLHDSNVAGAGQHRVRLARVTIVDIFEETGNKSRQSKED